MTRFGDRPPVNFSASPWLNSDGERKNSRIDSQGCRVNDISPEVESKAVLHLWARV